MTASSVAGSPRQWSARTVRSVRRRTWRRTRAATTASSSGPTTGMNSGIRSRGERNQATANHSHRLLLLGTRGSPSNPRKRTTRFGMRPASSRAADFRPRAMSTRIATSHTPTTAATVMSRPRSISGRLRRAGRRRSRSAAREYPGARGRRSLAELRDVDRSASCWAGRRHSRRQAHEEPTRMSETSWRGERQMPNWLWIVIVVVVILAIFGGIRTRR